MQIAGVEAGLGSQLWAFLSLFWSTWLLWVTGVFVCVFALCACVSVCVSVCVCVWLCESLCVCV